MTETEDVVTHWAKQRAAIEKANSLNKVNVFAALSSANITRVCVGFDGEGDSGQIDHAVPYQEDGAVEFPQTSVAFYRTHSECEELTTKEMSLREAVEELAYDYLELEHGGWENDGGAFGEFTFDVAKRTIKLDFNGRFVDYCHESTVF